MKENKNSGTHRFSRYLFLLLTICILAGTLFLASCGKQAAVDYSGDPAYQSLFEEGDDADAIELKNIIIAQILAYNAGDAETYYALFDMDKADRKFNIETDRAMRLNYDMTYTLLGLHTAFLDPINAQVLLTVECRAVDKTSGEMLYDTQTEFIYTLKKVKKKWKVFEQDKGEEVDLTGTYENPNTKQIEELLGDGTETAASEG